MPCQILGCYKNKSTTGIGVRLHILKGSSILFSNYQCFVETLIFRNVFFCWGFFFSSFGGTELNA